MYADTVVICAECSGEQTWHWMWYCDISAWRWLNNTSKTTPLIVIKRLSILCMGNMFSPNVELPHETITYLHIAQMKLSKSHSTLRTYWACSMALALGTVSQDLYKIDKCDFILTCPINHEFLGRAVIWVIVERYQVSLEVNEVK